MLKYFFNLYFTYASDGKNLDNFFHIGYFSSKNKAMAMINKLKDKIGFKDYPVDCFIIDKIGMHITEEIKSKSGINLFELSHEYEKDGESHWTVFGIFQSKQSAQIELSKQKNKKAYKAYPDGFIIDKWLVDKQFAWLEGFTKA